MVEAGNVALLPRHATFEDLVTPDLADLQAPRSYAVGGSFLGHTLPRWGVFLVWYMLTPLVLPLMIAIFLTGRYRLKTDGVALRILRVFACAAWSGTKCVATSS